MNTLKFLLFLLLIATSSFAGGLQNSDFATPAQITGAGGSLTQLLNETNIWSSVMTEQLSSALSNGDISNKLTPAIMGQFATPAPPAAGFDKLYFKAGDVLAFETSAGAEQQIFVLPALTAGSILFSNGSTIAQDNADLNWNAANFQMHVQQPSAIAGVLPVLTVTVDPAAAHNHGDAIAIDGNPGGGAGLLRTDGGANNSFLEFFGGASAATGGALYVKGNNAATDAGGIQTVFGQATSSLDIFDVTNTTKLLSVLNSGIINFPGSMDLLVNNAGAVGTTVNKLAKLSGNPSTALITATTDTFGAIGVVTAGAGTSGQASVAQSGIVSCVFDAGTTAGDFVQISGSTAGDCHDSGAAIPATGQIIGRVLSTNGGAGTYLVAVNSPNVLPPSAGAGGTVTSVNLADTSTTPIYATSGGPITTFGTLDFTLLNENANIVFAGPNGGGPAQPTFRALVPADIPNLDFSKITTGVVPIAQGGTGQTTQTTGFDALSPLMTKGDLIGYNGTHNVRFPVGADGQVLSANSAQPDGLQWINAGSGSVTSVALSDGSTTPIYAISGSPVTTSGTLTFTLSNENAHLAFLGPNGGAPAQPTFRAIVAADLPNTIVYNNQANTYTAGPQSLGSQVLSVQIANDGVTGTSVNHLAKLTAAGKAILAATTDITGELGIVVAGAGIVGSADIAQVGQASCLFDGSTVAGDFVAISSSSAGDCHDAGNSYPASGQVLGQVLTTNVGAGLYSMVLFPPVANGIAAGGGTVTSFSFTNANGVTGVVVTPTTTPNLTLTLGNITPTSVAATGTVTGSNLSGTNTGDVTLTPVGAAPNADAASLAGQVLTLQPFSAAFPGVVSASGGGTSNFLRADGSWAVPPGSGGTAATPTFWAMTGGVTFGLMDGPDVAEVSKTISKVVCDLRNSGVSGNTVVTFNYGPALASSFTLTIAANGGLNFNTSVPVVTLNIGDYIDAQVTTIPTGNPQDLRCKVLY